ncbi:unnamed protein product [Polarella glacialis]|uniref:Uncharacterized protein n=1 Tax=Polarella glacialis TaxID=89957 RepID=A0A813FR10_POLGL|nr:unnamed protein product [Polarella glacialis]
MQAAVSEARADLEAVCAERSANTSHQQQTAIPDLQSTSTRVEVQDIHVASQLRLRRLLRIQVISSQLHSDIEPVSCRLLPRIFNLLWKLRLLRIYVSEDAGCCLGCPR